MEENIYLYITNEIKNFPEEDQIALFNELWGNMNREERLVFTIDALEAFEKQGCLNEFCKGINKKITEKQDAILDDYINGKMTKKEFLEKIKKVRKIEKK